MTLFTSNLSQPRGSATVPMSSLTLVAGVGRACSRGMRREPETLAARLGATERNLSEWRITSRGPRFIRVGRSPRYRPEAVDEWLLAQESAESISSRSFRSSSRISLWSYCPARLSPEMTPERRTLRKSPNGKL